MDADINANTLKQVKRCLSVISEQRQLLNDDLFEDSVTGVVINVRDMLLETFGDGGADITPELWSAVQKLLNAYGKYADEVTQEFGHQLGFLDLSKLEAWTEPEPPFRPNGGQRSTNSQEQQQGRTSVLQRRETD